MIKKVLLIVALIFCGYPALAYAGSLQVQPVQIDLSQKQPIASMKLINTGNSAIIIQATIKHWQQKNGNDIYQKSSDLIVTPPIMTIPSHGTQIIRLGLTNSSASSEESAYRLYLEEIPPYHEPDSKTKGIMVLLQISIPVFVAPTTATAQSDLHWQLERINTKQLRVRLTNSGNMHAKITELTLMQHGRSTPLLAQPMLRYVLPQQSSTWLFNIPSMAGQELKLTANTDSGNVTKELKVTSA